MFCLLISLFLCWDLRLLCFRVICLPLLLFDKTCVSSLSVVFLFVIGFTVSFPKCVGFF